MKTWMLCVPTVLVVTLLDTPLILAASTEQGRQPYPEESQLVREGQRLVDEAWEIYHRAALSGTLASPALQGEIEQHLHEARTLMTQAQEAAERGEPATLQHLVANVHVHTMKAIRASEEPKP